jgi:hypothetical protein
MKKLTKIHYLIICSWIILISCAELPGFQKNMREIGNTARELNYTTHQIKGLANSLKMTKKEFDNTITVFKGGNSSIKRSAIPKGKETEFVIKKGKTQNLEWEPIANFDDQLFPSSIISLASSEKQFTTPSEKSITGSLGFRFLAKQSYIPIRCEIECVEKKYFDKISQDFVYQKEGYGYDLMMNIPWDFEKLTQQVTDKPIKVYFRLYDDKGNVAEKVKTLTMRSIDDCLLMYNGIDMRYNFAAYIQEQHPDIDKILREGLNTKMTNRWLGYQNGPEEVDTQIATIWRVLHERGFVYSSITDNVGDKGRVFSQTVRTFDMSIKTSQANCVDGTIVFASILKRIGISPLLVLVPGHCFLGYYTSSNSKTRKLKYLETTMVGDIGNLNTKLSPKAQRLEYMRLFNSAQKAGNARYNNEVKRSPERVKIIDVLAARNIINPIPFYQ